MTDGARPDLSRRDVRPLAWLHVRSAGEKPAPLAVRGTFVTIGSSPDDDVAVHGAGLAGRHGQFRLRGGVWTFANLHPSTLLWIDGEPVADEALLAPGSIICLGDTTMAFAPVDRWDDSPSRRDDIRAPLLIVPSERGSFWPTALFVLALGVVMVAAIALMRGR